MSERKSISVKAIFWEGEDLVIECKDGKIITLEGAVVTNVTHHVGDSSVMTSEVIDAEFDNVIPVKNTMTQEDRDLQDQRRTRNCTMCNGSRWVGDSLCQQCT